MARILRGDIYWADPPVAQGHEQAGRRPVLVLSHEIFNERSGTVVGLAITSKAQNAGFPLSFELPTDLLPKPSWVKIGHIHTLSVARLGKKLARLGEAEINQIIEGLLEIVGP